MSEYQYYEFATIDRPLSRAEMAELRADMSPALARFTAFLRASTGGSETTPPG